MQYRSSPNLVLGVDDGYFPPSYKSGRGKTLLVGVLTREKYIIQKIFVKKIPIDSRQTTPTIIEFLRSTKPELVLLDGITYAGFDVVEPNIIYSETHVPITIIQQYPLNLERIRKALQKHFPDYKERYRIIEETYSKMVYLETPWKKIQVYMYPQGIIDVKLLKELMIYSPIPEPLRLAHVIASSLSRTMYSKGLL